MSEPDYEAVAIKRRWVPEWLWWLACVHVPTVQFKQLVTLQPVRRWLAEEVDGHGNS